MSPNIIPDCDDMKAARTCDAKCPVTDCFVLKYCPEDWYFSIRDKITLGSYGKGQKVIFKGSPVQWICIVHTGKLKIYNENNHGREVILRLAKAGDIIGYSAMGDKLIYSSSASAIEDTSVCFIPKNVFLELVMSNPEVTGHIMMHLLEELRKAEVRINNLALYSVKQRIANVLLMMNELREDKTSGFNVALTRREIADYAATSPEETSRIISSFSKEGIVRVDKKKNKMFLLKPEELQRLIEQ